MSVARDDDARLSALPHDDRLFNSIKLINVCKAKMIYRIMLSIQQSVII